MKESFFFEFKMYSEKTFIEIIYDEKAKNKISPTNFASYFKMTIHEKTGKNGIEETYETYDILVVVLPRSKKDLLLEEEEDGGVKVNTKCKFLVTTIR